MTFLGGLGNFHQLLAGKGPPEWLLKVGREGQG